VDYVNIISSKTRSQLILMAFISYGKFVG